MRVPTGLLYGKGGHPSHTDQALKLLSPDELALSLYPIMRENVFFDEDDFSGVLNGDKWTVSGDTGASNFAWAAGQNGLIEGQAHSDANDGVGIRYNKAVLSGDKNAGVEFLFSVETVGTTSRLDMGLTDAITDVKDNVVNDIDTPTTTNGAGDCAIFAIDTSQTLITGALVGTDSGAGTTKTVLAPTFSPTAGLTNFYRCRIQLWGNDAYCWVWTKAGVLVGYAKLDNALEGGTALFPFFCYTTVSGAARKAHLDYIRMWQDR